jgi:subtilisin family serine protease
MKLTKLLMLFVVFALIAGAAEAKNYFTEKKDTKTAVESGCTIVKSLRHVDVLECSDTIATALTLQEDLPVHAMDINANTQIKANQVQVNGYTGAGRKIVVLDSGYNYNHPELSSSYLGGKDFVNNDNDPMDDNGHGSFVSGLITADGIDANAKGVAPGTGIIMGKVLDANAQGSFSTIVDAIYWAVNGPDGVYGTADDFKADAISMSIGTNPPNTYVKTNCDTFMPSLTNAINYAISKGVTVVAAAGNNDGSGVSIPGCVSSALTVGSVDGTDALAAFSGQGKTVDVTAPGVSLFSAWTGTGYYTASGTSASTPIVAGTIALIKQRSPAYTTTQVYNALTKTAVDLGKRGFDNGFGYGRINALAAVNY